MNVEAHVLCNLKRTQLSRPYLDCIDLQALEEKLYIYIYINIGKYPDLKGKIYGLHLNDLFRINKPYLKLLGTSDG